MSNEPSTALAERDPDLARVATLGKWLALSETGKDDPQAQGASAALRLWYAKELGLTALAANELSVIKGRLVVQSKLLRGLAVQRGYRVVRDPKSNSEACTAILTWAATREEIGRYTFTIADAKRAGLVRERSAWITHPARMLWARASKFVLDDYAPEVTLGLLTQDEADEIAGRPTPPPPPDEVEAESELEEDDIEFPDPEPEPPTETAGGLKTPVGVVTPTP